MYKQQQYDQGVQKIQGYIDNVAGMEVMNTAQQSYIQSKLNDLGSRLKTVAAGDFSNNQLVNSVGGMATSIVKDSVVQNAVASTQRAKTELSTAESLYKAGKSSIDNVSYLKNQISEYANSTDVKASFTDKYVNFIDLPKKWMELADNLKKSAPEKSIDNPYMSDSKGDTIYYKKDKDGKVISASTDVRSGGVPELDVVMKKTTIKGVSAQAMYDAMKNTLSSDDLKQMEINAWSQYRGKGPESVITDLTTANTLAKNMLSDEIERLNVNLQDSKLTQDEKLKIQADINRYSNKLTDGSFEKSLADEIIALENPANLKAGQFNAYTKRTLNGEARTLSNQSFKQELIDNPYEAANMKRKTLQQTILNDNREYILKVDTLAETKAKNKWEREQATKKWDDEHPMPTVYDRAISTNISAPTIGNLETDIKGISDNITELGNNYGPMLGLGKFGLDLLYDKYTKDQSSIVGNNSLEYVRARAFNELQIVRKNNVKKLVERGSKKFDDKIDAQLASMTGITDVNGKTLFTAKEIYDVDQLISKNYKTSTDKNFLGGVASSGIGAPGLMPVFNEAELIRNIGNDPKKMAIATTFIKRMNGQALTPTERIIANKMTDLHKQMDSTSAAVQKEKFDYQTKTIADLDPTYQEQFASLDDKNTTDMRKVQSVINNAIQQYIDSGSIDLPPGAKFSPDDMNKLNSGGEAGKGDIRRTIIKSSDGSGLLIVGQGENVQTIKMNASTFSKEFPNYAKSNPFNADFKAVQASQYKTTNTSDGPGDKSQDALTAAHSGFEMPLLASTPWANKVRYDIIGSSQNSGSADDDKFGIRLFIENKGTWIPVVSQGGYKNAATIQSDIENLIGPNTIELLLKQYK